MREWRTDELKKWLIEEIVDRLFKSLARNTDCR